MQCTKLLSEITFEVVLLKMFCYVRHSHEIFSVNELEIANDVDGWHDTGCSNSLNAVGYKDKKI